MEDNSVLKTALLTVAVKFAGKSKPAVRRVMNSSFFMGISFYMVMVFVVIIFRVVNLNPAIIGLIAG